MNREQLAHILRAASKIVEDPNIVVLGSQAILGSHDADDLPEEATRSIEADVAFWDDPDNVKSDDVDGAIGELSAFHATFGYYAQGVSISTAVLPAGWRDRLVPFDPTNPDSAAVCLDPHDLVLAKLVAGREKDLEFATALLSADLIDDTLLVQRSLDLPVLPPILERVRHTIQRCARR
ncbi:MAG: hypothetical protein H0W25_06730 [Acidimicrobiia bacterium]|nr:hypothetical protein [Acidimicrobiia bacterium]